MSINPIDLKERIAISDAFTAEERDFILDAINRALDSDAPVSLARLTDRGRRKLEALVEAPASEITGHDLHRLLQGCCPECGGQQFQPGPKGGSAQNFECVACRQRFNIAIIGDAVMFAQRIGSNADWETYYALHKPRRLIETKQ